MAAGATPRSALASAVVCGTTRSYHAEWRASPRTVKSSISLTEEQDAFVRLLVGSGRYPDASSVVQQGLELLRQNTSSVEAETAALRLVLEQRRQGAFVTEAEMQRRVSRLIRRKRREHAPSG